MQRGVPPRRSFSCVILLLSSRASRAVILLLTLAFSRPTTSAMGDDGFHDSILFLVAFNQLQDMHISYNITIKASPHLFTTVSSTMALRTNLRILTSRLHENALNAMGHSQQKRNISIVDKLVIRSPASEQLSQDLSRAIALVQKYDPVGYLPGLLISTNTGKIGYFASKEYLLTNL
jgi:hypothetical protein